LISSRMSEASQRVVGDLARCKVAVGFGVGALRIVAAERHPARGKVAQIVVSPGRGLADLVAGATP